VSTTVVDIVELADEDLRRVFAAATALAEPDADDQSQSLRVVRSLIDCDVASFNDMLLSTQEYRAIADPPAERGTPSTRQAFEQYVHQHPILRHRRATRTNMPLRLCDVPDGGAFERTHRYAGLYAPLDLHYQLTVTLPAPPDVVLVYALSRSRTAGEFSDRDVAVLAALRPHLVMHHHAVVQRAMSSALAGEVAGAGWLVLLADRDGTITSTSDSPPTASLEPGQLLPTELRTLVDRLHGEEEAMVTVELDGQMWRCIVRAMEVGPSVVIARPVENPITTMTATLRMKDAGLTPRQIEVAHLLAETGGTNAQLARALEISESTVKKHLESVFLALDVDNRSAAIVVLSS
jgi:DNA-binding CsgD family transcriptional regulator